MLKRLSNTVATPRGFKLQFEITLEKMLSLDSSLALERVPNSMRSISFTNSAGKLIVGPI